MRLRSRWLGSVHPVTSNAPSQLDYISHKPLQVHAPSGLRLLEAEECWEMKSGRRPWLGEKECSKNIAARNVVFGKCLAVLEPQIFPF